MKYSYAKKNHYNFASLSCEERQMLRDYFGGNLWQSEFFGSGPGFVNRTQSDPGFVNPVRSGPGFVNPIRSGPGARFSKDPVS